MNEIYLPISEFKKGHVYYDCPSSDRVRLQYIDTIGEKAYFEELFTKRYNHLKVKKCKEIGLPAKKNIVGFKAEKLDMYKLSWTNEPQGENYQLRDF